MARLKTLIPRYEDRPIPGLPDRCYVFTNSERNDAACPAAYRFRHIDGLRFDTTAAPLRYGTAWHDVAEAVFRWWMDNNGARLPDALIDDTITAVRDRWFDEAAANPNYDSSEIEPSIERLRRAWVGWVHLYGNTPPAGFDVVAVEIPLAAPVVNPDTGRPYRPTMPVTTDDNGATWRPCRTGETAAQETKVQNVRYPWYQVGRLDAVLRHRDTGALWGWDHKTSAAPASFLKNVTVDPQSQGYVWLLEYNVRAGLFGDDPDARVGGFVFDVVSNRGQYDPAVLKNGTLSTSKSKTVPSWRFTSAINALGLDPAKYTEHVLELARVNDAKLYKREWLSVGPSDRARYGREAFAISSRLATMRRNAGRATNAASIDLDFPRVPVCRSPGSSCSYRGPCLADGEDVRRSYVVTPGLRWVPNFPKTSAGADAPDDNNNNNPQPPENLGW